MHNFQLDDAIKSATRATGSAAALLFVASQGRVSSAGGYVSAAGVNIDATRGVRLAAAAIAAGLPQSDGNLLAHSVGDLALVLADPKDPHAAPLYPWLHCIDFALRSKQAEDALREATDRAEGLRLMDHATREVFVLMGRSRTDARPVLDLIVESVLRLCDGVFADVFLTDGAQVHLVAHNFAAGVTDIDNDDHPMKAYPLPLNHNSLAGRVILDTKLHYSPDVFNDSNVTELTRRFAKGIGFATSLMVPMVRDGRGIGCIGVAGERPYQFSEQQIRLVQTFADQAAIAVESERLFSELEARNAALTQGVAEQRALNEVSRALSTTLNTDEVFKIILEKANLLADAQSSWLNEYDEATGTFHQRAMLNINYVPAGGRTVLGRGDGLAGKVAQSLRPMQVPDILAEGAYESSLKAGIVAEGFRAILVVPLLREEIGRAHV